MDMSRPTCVRILNGLGDSIYHRPFIQQGWCLHTRYPELFRDLDVTFNCGGDPQVKTSYTSRTIALTNTIGAIERWLPKTDNFKFELPDYGEFPNLENYVVIRPPMIRKDFYAPSRNPKSEYLQEANRILQEAGYTTVGVAYQRADLEYPDGTLPDVHIRYYDGELDIPQLMSLVAGAKLVIGGPGWQVPTALAYGVPITMIYGGMGGCNRWEKLTDPRIKEPRIEIIEPDNFCRCSKLEHNCNKEISDFARKFSACLN